MNLMGVRTAQDILALARLDDYLYPVSKYPIELITDLPNMETTGAHYIAKARTKSPRDFLSLPLILLLNCRLAPPASSKMHLTGEYMRYCSHIY